MTSTKISSRHKTILVICQKLHMGKAEMWILYEINSAQRGQSHRIHYAL
jgi:hypothetical protein